MGRYGLIEDTSEEDSFDTSQQHQQQHPRKRTYPLAFPAEREEEIYPYAAVPVAIMSHEGVYPLGPTSSAVLKCFRIALGWVGSAVLEYGGKFFAAGTKLSH